MKQKESKQRVRKDRKKARKRKSIRKSKKQAHTKFLTFSKYIMRKQAPYIH